MKFSDENDENTILFIPRLAHEQRLCARAWTQEE